MNKTTTILLVEDSQSDARLLVEAIKQRQLTGLCVLRVEDGEFALQLLKGASPANTRTAIAATSPAQAPQEPCSNPDLIVLDLNLPRKDGRELLADLQADPELSGIPVVVLSTSNAESDLAYCSAHGVRCYHSKPFRLSDYGDVVSSILRNLPLAS